MKDVSLILYPVGSADATKPFFRELIGSDPYVDSPYYTGYKSGETEIGLAQTPDPAAVAYWTVEDIEAKVNALVDLGGTVSQPVGDVGQGLLVATVKAPNGSVVGLRQFPK